MFQKIISCASDGLDACPVDTEIDIAAGMPYFTVIGVSESAARGIRERIRSALAASGFSLPPRRITVNLSSVPKCVLQEGLDLPIALGILCAERFLPDAFSSTHLIVGTLSLNGELKPVRGALNMALLCRRLGFPHLLVPAENAAEAALIQDVSVVAVHTLSEAILYLRGQLAIEPAKARPLAYRQPSFGPLLSIRGQLPGKRALEIACAGYHNLLFCGPPGCGKTLLLESIVSLLPPPTQEEQLELLRIASVCGMDTLDPDRYDAAIGALESGGVPASVSSERPLRRPHHSVSTHALIGGGRPVQPGELTRAHGGVLMLDEIAEFPRTVLENLRQPLESHEVRLHYLDEVQCFPADFLLAAAMNLCPCGYYPDPERCTCRPGAIRRYQARLGAPLLERIDLCLTLDPVPADDMNTYSEAEALRLRERIEKAAERQRRRFREEPFCHNSRMTPEALKKYARLTSSAETVLKQGAARLGLSLRTQHNTIKTARSIADLAEKDEVGAEEILEALQYRPRGFLM